jgi:peptidoglycan/LPS O-acetylase OafA/YrhL
VEWEERLARIAAQEEKEKRSRARVAAVLGKRSYALFLWEF